MTERIQTNLENALKRQDAIAVALKEITKRELAGRNVSSIVKELAEAGIELDKSPRTIEDIYNNWI